MSAAARDAGALRWLVSGYYGAGNLGDEALLAGLLSGLRARGATRLAVLSLAPATSAARHGVQAHHRLSGLPRALVSCDVLVSGGGGLLQDATSARSLGYYLAVIGLARRLGRRTLVFGQSLGPLSERGRRRVRAALRGVPLGLRDDPSLALAAELGLDATGVADAALLLPAPAERDRDALVVVPRGDQPLATEALTALALRARSEGSSVVAVALQPSQDGAAARRIAAAADGTRVLDADDTHAVLAVMAAARLVVSVRLHGLVLAAVARAPHVGLSYDPKVAGFASRSGAACARVPATSDEVAAQGAALLAHWRAPSIDLAACTSLRSDAEAGLDWLVWSALHGRSSTSA